MKKWVYFVITIIFCFVMTGCQEKNITIDFNTNGGTYVDRVLFDDNEIKKINKVSFKEGYTFVGWYSENDYINKIDTTEDIHSNVILYAKWEANYYTITFETSGGSEVGSIQAQYNQKIEQPENPNKNGFEFAGWYLDEIYSQIFMFDKMPNKNMTLHARWLINTFAVKFIDDQNRILKIDNVKYGENAIAPELLPEKEGYTFDRWDKEYNNITENLEIKAIYKINSYTMSFETNGGSSVGSITCEYLTEINKPDEPIKDGYIFSGWYEDSLFTFPYTFKTMPAINTTVYAKWIVNNYRVTFIANDNIIDEQIINYGDDAVAPIPPSKEGYEFVSWDNDFSNVQQRLLIKAVYKPIKVQIDFEVNGGSLVEPLMADYNEIINAPISPMKKGYSFEGWYKDVDLSTVYTFDIMPLESFTLYAKWNINPYNVTFYNEDGTIISQQQVLYNEDAIVPNEPNKEGYTFDKWDTLYTNVSDNLNIYPIFIANRYTIVFNSNGGSVVDNIDAEYETKINRPSDPYKENYIFIGWFRDLEISDEYNFDIMPLNGLTLTARWMPSIHYALKANDEYEIVRYVGLDKVVNIPETYNGKPVTSIGKYAFENCTSLERMDITSNNIKKIDSFAFANCNNLQVVTIPNSVIYIGLGAFNGCHKICQISLPFTGVTRNCDINLSSLGIIFDNVTSENVYKQEIFYKDINVTTICYIPKTLKSVIITGNIETIRISAFYDCIELENITLSNSINKIEDSAFYNCQKLKSINLPKNLSEIGKEIFFNCNSLY